MGEFVVSALKYRPQTFADVVGQQAITQTLQNAIDLGKIAKAMLFCGPRGVGKTTCARIFAKKINSDTAPIDPNEDFAFNVFELDAASNNSVADIRNLIEQVRIPPQKGIYKVYIIDEVHMLSSAAFNAFLKTLEEPPQHAIFILATTEKQKIIPTILSRCQIFDFRRITIKDAQGYLKTIASREGINAEDDALHLIAQKADGAMRDALSIFDRMVSYSGETLTAKQVSLNLNILDHDSYLNLTDLIHNGDLHGSILQFNSLIDLGFDGYHIINGLSKHLRDLLMCQNDGTTKLLEVGAETEAKFHTQAKGISTAFLLQTLELTNSYALQYKSSLHPHLQVELCLMQIASLKEGEKKKPKPYIKPKEEIASSKLANAVGSVETIEKHDSTPSVSPVENKVADKVEASPSIDTVSEVVETVDETAVQLDLSAQGVSGLSLSSLRVQKEHQTKIIDTGDEEKINNQEVRQDALIEQWESYTKRMANRGERNMVALLQLDIPRLKNKTEIHLSVPNDTNKIELEKNSTSLLQFLRKQLLNDHLNLHLSVDLREEKKFIYTAEDKYQELLEKNPMIKTFKKNFNLEY
ncbi:MAG: DNA polymerase III subunit tau [Bacteroidota bacterium]|nr:MAG: DNA polymerase III subunit tau [Bacteroidota bacterium]